jgi:phosphatidylserine decarboxylase
MNRSDVHVNRAPMAGRVHLVERVHGTFGSLRKPEMVQSNERVTTVIGSEESSPSGLFGERKSACGDCCRRP